jgi:hypothetical protein
MNTTTAATTTTTTTTTAPATQTCTPGPRQSIPIKAIQDPCSIPSYCGHYLFIMSTDNKWTNKVFAKMIKDQLLQNDGK